MCSNISLHDLKQQILAVHDMKLLFRGSNSILHSSIYQAMMQHAKCLVTHIIFNLKPTYVHYNTAVYNYLSMSVSRLQLHQDACNSKLFQNDFCLLLFSRNLYQHVHLSLKGTLFQKYLVTTCL